MNFVGCGTYDADLPTHLRFSPQALSSIIAIVARKGPSQAVVLPAFASAMRPPKNKPKASDSKGTPPPPHHHTSSRRGASSAASALEASSNSSRSLCILRMAASIFWSRTLASRCFSDRRAWYHPSSVHQSTNPPKRVREISSTEAIHPRTPTRQTGVKTL